jgi:hypothetical protein
VKTFGEVATWCAGASEEFDDPSVPVCQLFFRWQEDLATYGGDELACGILDGEFVLVLGPGFPSLPMPVKAGQPQIRREPAVELEAYGAELVSPGVWSLAPSLNAEGLIHAFVVLYGVPDPAPWGMERRIILAPGFREALLP